MTIKQFNSLVNEFTPKINDNVKHYIHLGLDYNLAKSYLKDIAKEEEENIFYKVQNLYLENNP